MHGKRVQKASWWQLHLKSHEAHPILLTNEYPLAYKSLLKDVLVTLFPTRTRPVFRYCNAKRSNCCREYPVTFRRNAEQHLFHIS